MGLAVNINQTNLRISHPAGLESCCFQIIFPIDAALQLGPSNNYLLEKLMTAQAFENVNICFSSSKRGILNLLQQGTSCKAAASISLLQ